MKILIADDIQTMRTLLKELATKVYPDADFLEAGSGSDALEICTQQNPDILLLDVLMKKESGIDVLKALQGKFEGKIVVISAMGQATIIEEAKSLGATGFIVKPFEEQDVLDILKNI